MDRYPKKYTDVVDEWLAWQANAGQAAPKFTSVADYAQFMDSREGAENRKSAYDPAIRQQLNDAVERTMAVGASPGGEAYIDPMLGLVQPPAYSPGVKASDVGRAFGETAGQAMESVFPSKINPPSVDTRHPTEQAMFPSTPTPMTTEPNPETVDVMGEVGAGMPRALGQVGLAATGPAGMAGMLADAHLQAYGPMKDDIAGFTAPASMLAGALAVPVAGRAAETATAKAFQPAFQDLVQAPGREYGRQAAKMLVPNATAENAISAARIGAETAVGTGVGEASRIAEGWMRGDEITLADRGEGKTAVFDPLAVAANVAGSLAFAPLDVATRVDPTAVRRGVARATIADADTARVGLARLNDSRGARIATTHRSIRDAALRGEDVTPLMEELRSHYVEADAARQPTAESAGRVLMASADEANNGRMSDLEINQIFKAVQGRFDEMVARDPNGPSPSGAAINELVKAGQLPRLTERWISENFREAYEQALGDGPVARAGIVNRIVAEYEDRAPAAMEAYRKMPRETGLLKSQLDAQGEADRDRMYIESLIALQPHMTGKKAADNTPLDEALWARDMALSEATQGGQLNSESAAWGVYDGWKDEITRFAKTYDPVTRTGEFALSRRMSDGSIVSGTPERVSIEDLVKRADGEKRYEINAGAKTTRASSVSARTSLDELLQFYRARDAGDEPDSARAAGEFEESGRRKSDKKRAKETVKKSNADVDLEAEQTLQNEINASFEQAMLDEKRAAAGQPVQADPVAIEALKTARAAGMDPATTAKFVKQKLLDAAKRADAPAFGFDMSEAKNPTVEEASLWLVRKVSDMSNDELWKRYGGAQVFGKGQFTPGKRELFKDAILAKMEMDVMGEDTGHITATQERFYNAWRAFADQKEGSATKVAESWEKKREQLRHALRLYWRAHESVGAEKNFFVSLLDDRPDYQNMLRAGQAKIESQSGSTPESVGAKSMIDDFSRVGRPTRVQTAGQTNPVMDTVRMFRGYARKLGRSEADADAFALSAAKIQQAFDENSRVALDPNGASARYLGYNMPGRGGQDRPMVVMNFDKIDATAKNDVVRATRALQVMAHELTHNYTGVGKDAPSVWKQQRIDAYHKLAGLFEELGVDSTYDLLHGPMREVFFPPEFMPETKTSLTYPGASFADEAVANLMEYVVLGGMARTMDKGSARTRADTASEAFQWLPDDVQAFTRLAYRDVADFVGGLEDHYKQRAANDKPGWTSVGTGTADFKTIQAFLRPLSDYSQQFLGDAPRRAAEYEAVGKATIAKLNALGSMDLGDPIAVRTTEMMSRQELDRISKQNRISYSVPEGEDPYGFKETQERLFGPTQQTPKGPFRTADEKTRGVEAGGWSQYLGQTYQLLRKYQRAGIALADPAARLMNDLEPAYWRLTQQLHAPFTIQDKTGLFKYDPNHPIQQLLQNRHPEARRAKQTLENLRLWSQEQKAPVVTYDEQGQAVVHPDATAVVQREFAGLSPEMQQGTLTVLAGLVDGYRRAAEMRLTAETEAVAAQVAKFFMVRDKGLFYDTAYNQAQVAVKGLVQLERARDVAQIAEKAAADVQAKQTAQPSMLPGGGAEMQQVVAARQALALASQQFAELTKGLSTDQMNILTTYVGGPGGAATGLIQMADKFQTRAGWYISEARSGQYITFAKTPDGEQYSLGSKTRREAAKLEERLAREGYSEIGTKDRNDPANWELFDVPDQAVNDFIKIEQGAWQNFLKRAQSTLSEEDFTAVQADPYVPGLASSLKIQNKSLDRYMQPRKLAAGREDLNSFEVFTDYTRRMVGTVARRALRQQTDLLLRDPRAKGQGEFQKTVREATATLLQPVSDEFMTWRAGITATFLGMPNFVSPVVETTQAMTTVFPELVRATGSFTNAVKYFGRALTVPGAQMMDNGSLEHRRLIQSASTKEVTDPKSMTKDESLAYYYQRSRQEGRFSHGVIQQEMTARDFGSLRQWASGMGLEGGPETLGELSKDVIYRLAQVTMYPYSKVSGFNNRVAFLAGLEMLYDQGYRGRELYEKAHVFKDTATFGGGKANEVGYVSKLANPRTRSWFSLVNTLQRYSFGSTTMIKDYVGEIVGSDVAPRDRAAATKAVATALSAQAVLGGALAVPGALLVAAAMEKLFGVDVKQAGRDAVLQLSKRLGTDDPMAVAVANIAQNGVGGQFLGMDLSSRFALNSFLGFDAYEGWDFGNFGGPAVGLVERAVHAGQHVAKGELVKSAKYALPPSFTPAIDVGAQLAQYGEVGMRDASGGLIRKTTPWETAKYAAGVRPYWYRQFRDEQKSLDMSNDAYRETLAKQVDEAATALLKGDSKPAMEWVRQSVARVPGSDPSVAQKQVVDRGLVQSNARDLLRNVAAGNESRAQAIAASYGDSTRQSELELLKQRAQLGGQIGMKPPEANDIIRAGLVDALVKQGMTRQEALRKVEALGF